MQQLAGHGAGHLIANQPTLARLSEGCKRRPQALRSVPQTCCVVSTQCAHFSSGALQVPSLPSCLPAWLVPCCVAAGEQRLISLRCRATIGAVSNPQNKNRVLGKAGANRWRGRRPAVGVPLWLYGRGMWWQWRWQRGAARSCTVPLGGGVWTHEVNSLKTATATEQALRHSTPTSPLRLYLAALRRAVRPQVRGVAMNPVDHPMGGGTAGGRPSCSPWGLNSKGKKTRKKHKASDKWILQRRTKRG